MSKQSWILICTLAGMLLPFQAVLNARMREYVGNPLFTTVINFSVGLLLILCIAALSARLGQPGDIRGALEAPWWAWLGGAIGITLVSISFLALPHIGSASLTGAAIVGQLLAAVLIDNFGLLGVPVHSLSVSRVLGIVALLGGLYLVRR